MTNMASFLLGRSWPVDPLILVDEAADQRSELVRLLHLNAMAGGPHSNEPRLRQQRRIALPGALRHHLVVVAPHNERRSAHAAEQVRQGLTVHVRLPGDPKAHLAAEVPIDE